VELENIAARAARLDERLTGMVQLTGPADPDCVTARLERWGKSLRITQCEAPELAARIGRNGLDVSCVAALLGPVSWPAGSSLPDWASVLASLVEIVEAGGTSEAALEFGRVERPFEHILRP